MIGRCLAGVLLGFPLAAWLLRLLLAPLPHHGAEWIIPALILFVPLWIALIAAAFTFRNAARAWMTFGCANAAAFALTQWIG
jgi:uncharacterized membrane protein